jgi:hypothetical protein
MEPINFSLWLEHTAKIGTVRTRPIPDQIAQLDRAVRRLAATDPLYPHTPELRAYANGKPWRAALGD